jgi:hypothetical protein
VAKASSHFDEHTAALKANTTALNKHTKALITHTVAVTAASALVDKVVWRSAHCVNGSRAVKKIDGQGNLYDDSEPC